MTEHQKKWMKRMVEVHGTEEDVKRFMSQSAKLVKNTSQKGFAGLKKKNPELQKEISRRGAKKRWNKDDL